MTRQILIDNIVRQVTVLIAQLATSGGVRSPLAQVADRVFLDLARELESQGISRKVSADMFGMALRSYRRRVRQLGESSTERGRSLWEVMLDYLSRGSLVTREQVLKRFHRDEESQVRGVLNDLCESGLIFRIGVGKESAYRAATSEEMKELHSRGDGLAELVWTLVYREGPLTEEELLARTGLSPDAQKARLDELTGSGRVERREDGRYSCRSVILPVGSASGWEAAFFDHFQAVVKTMCARLARNGDGANGVEDGGSTYTFSVWEGHPCEDEVRGLLHEFRERHSALRRRVRAYNDQHAPPPSWERVTVYGGLSITTEEGEDDESGEEG